MSAAARARAGGVVAVVLSLLLVAFLIGPLAEGVRGAFVDANGRFTFAYVATVFQSPITREGFRNALAIALFSTLVAGAVGIGAAFVLDRYAIPGRRVFAALRERRIPVALSMAGGYGREIDVTVAIQAATLRAAIDSWREWNNAGR